MKENWKENSRVFKEVTKSLTHKTINEEKMAPWPGFEPGYPFDSL